MSDVAPHNMTDNSTPAPYVASASSQYTTRAAYRGFDGGFSDVQYWMASAATGWLKIDLGADNQYLIVKYEVQISSIINVKRAPMDWTLQGSTNDSDWDILDTVTGEVDWYITEKREFICDVANTPYRYFKLVITANNGDSYLQIGELFLWEPPPYHLTGTIKEKGNPVVRTVRSYIRSTGTLYATTTSESDGSFSVGVPDNTTEMFVVAFDDDAGDQYNALVFDKVKGVHI